MPRTGLVRRHEGSNRRHRPRAAPEARFAPRTAANSAHPPPYAACARRAPPARAARPRRGRCAQSICDNYGAYGGSRYLRPTRRIKDMLWGTEVAHGLAQNLVRAIGGTGPFAFQRRRYAGGGRLAVQLFYVISGFLISYILNTNDAYRSTARFYENRLLRLFPTYLAVAGGRAGAELDRQSGIPGCLPAQPQQRGPVPGPGQSAHLRAGLADVLRYQGRLADAHRQLRRQRRAAVPGPARAAGVDAGSGTEFLPGRAAFILRSMRCVVALFVASVVLRLPLLHAGIAQSDPGATASSAGTGPVPAGALSHRLLLPLWQRLSVRFHYLPELATGLFVVYALFHFSVTINHNVRDALALGVFTGILPLAFIYQARHRLDKKIGQLSYPIISRTPSPFCWCIRRRAGWA